MSQAEQLHHVTLVPRPDAVERARDLLVRCADRVASRKAENGPSSWTASFDAERGCFYVDAVFRDDDAVAFHQANIQDLVAQFGGMMAAPPRTEIRRLFAVV